VGEGNDAGIIGWDMKLMAGAPLKVALTSPLVWNCYAEGTPYMTQTLSALPTTFSMVGFPQRPNTPKVHRRQIGPCSPRPTTCPGPSYLMTVATWLAKPARSASG
jgi:hypothetical protein